MISTTTKRFEVNALAGIAKPDSVENCGHGLPLLAVALLTTLVAAPPASAIGPTPPTREPRELAAQFIDVDAHRGADRALAYDHHGNPGISYVSQRSSVDVMFYAREIPGVGWAPFSLDRAGETGDFSRPSLAYDRLERPMLAYTFEPDPDDEFNQDGGVRVAHLRDEDWFVELAAPDDSASALAFDRLGRPAITYETEIPSIQTRTIQFKLDKNEDFEFAGETERPVFNILGAAPREPTLAFDDLNRPHSSWINAEDELHLSVKETDLPFRTGFVADDVSASSIAIDPDTGFPAIAFTDISTPGAARLGYAEWDGDDWAITTIDDIGPIALGSSGLYPSLAFDPAHGNPAIAYHVAQPLVDSRLKLAWHDGTMWRTQTVDSGTGVGLHPSLAFNDFGDGFPSISYLQDFNGDGLGDLLFIHDPPAAVPEPASMLIAGLGAFACLVLARRRRRRA